MASSVVLVSLFLSVLVMQGLMTNIRGEHASADDSATSPESSGSMDSQASFKPTYTHPVFVILKAPRDGANITVSAPGSVFNELVFLHVESSSGTFIHCFPLDFISSSDSDSGLAFAWMVTEQLPLDDYCVRLTCSCKLAAWCPGSLPPRCRAYPHRFGVDMDAWNVAVSIEQTSVAAGPGLSVAFQRNGYWFDSLRLWHDGCDGDLARKVEAVVNASDEYQLNNDNCSLVYNRAINMRVEPNTWYCRTTGNCRGIEKTVEPLRPPRREAPLPVRAAAPPPLLTAGLPVLVLAVLAVVAAGLLWNRRRHLRTPADPASSVVCRDNGVFVAADGSAVLLLHLARSDAERQAVQRLAAALSAGGAAVTDSATPDGLRALRGDVAALLAAGGRVVVLSSPALTAALAAGGGGGGSQQERLVAAAVRHLTASRLTTDYGRLCQAQLDSAPPLVAGLVPGAVYTLPEHHHELVSALLAAHTPCPSGTDKAIGAAKHAV